MTLALEVLSYWNVIDREESAVFWSVTVILKSLSEDELFSALPGIYHSEILG